MVSQSYDSLDAYFAQFLHPIYMSVKKKEGEREGKEESQCSYLELTSLRGWRQVRR